LTLRNQETEENLQGIGVSPGIAIGRALVLEGRHVGVVRVDLETSQTAREVARFRSAVRTAWRQIRELRDRIRVEAGEAYARVFQAQILILKDRALLREVEALIRRDPVNAEWALRTVIGRYTEVFAQLADAAQRDRGSDIEDVEARVQAALSGRKGRHDLAGLNEDVIVVSASLAPSDAAGLNRDHVVGLAIDGGGPTSHTAVIASALGVPAVAGLRDASARVRSGDLLALDGSSGSVTRNPSEADLERWREAAARLAQRERDLAALRDQPAATLDGARIALLANIEFEDETLAARRHGAEGIGLYRSEFLYLGSAPALPDEQRHYAVYRGLAERARPHEVVIRTLDLGGEKEAASVPARRELSPALGLRGVRLGLRRPEMFRVQLRGILRAAAHGKVRILLPMVGGLEELRQARAAVAEAARELAREGIPWSEVPLGVMIEVPAAALIVDRLAREADFLSLGTNDLIQYTLAVDRGSEAVSYLYQPLHPAILHLVRRVADEASRRGLRLSVCGEMAGDPVAAVALIGLGVTELSMTPAAIPAVKQVIRGVTLREARAMMVEALRLDTAGEVEEMVRRRVLSLLPTEFACPI